MSSGPCSHHWYSARRWTLWQQLSLLSVRPQQRVRLRHAQAASAKEEVVICLNPVHWILSLCASLQDMYAAPLMHDHTQAGVALPSPPKPAQRFTKKVGATSQVCNTC